jgi:glycosyltransferase involved in cell wall biosynthesis
MRLYAGPGRRRVLPPIVFGAGVLWHLLRHGDRYDVVHTASFPYFSLLAAAAARRRWGYRLVVDWHEVWSRSYWRDYLGRLGGLAGWLVQLACVRLRQDAFCFSRMHAQRLRAEGLKGALTVLRGQYVGAPDAVPASTCEPLVVFAGRLIPEKRATLGADAVAAAAPRIPGLRAVFYGEGPERSRLEQAVEQHGIGQIVAMPGFVPAEEIDRDLQRALCMLLPSRREGYGMVVVEASARGTPSIVVAGEDNAATELIEEGVNGVIVDRPDPVAIADAIVRVQQAGSSLRDSTAQWFAANSSRLSLESSLGTVVASYGTRSV